MPATNGRCRKHRAFIGVPRTKHYAARPRAPRMLPATNSALLFIRRPGAPGRFLGWIDSLPVNLTEVVAGTIKAESTANATRSPTFLDAPNFQRNRRPSHGRPTPPPWAPPRRHRRPSVSKTTLWSPRAIASGGRTRSLAGGPANFLRRIGTTDGHIGGAECHLKLARRTEHRVRDHAGKSGGNLPSQIRDAHAP